MSDASIDAIIDNPGRQRYEVQVDGATAYIAYTRAPGSIALVHTIVPDAQAGQGIASRLAKFALDAARSNGDKVLVQCSFIAAYVRKHPQYRDLIDI